MTSTPATASAQKPVLKGLNNAFIKKHLFIAIGLTAVATVAYKFLVNDPRKQAYADFYKKSTLINPSKG
uniref:Uncharacterized protein n=1 Tax=Megaselia scalaris TaxID=36166 RepID=T1GH71_MEGSC